MKKQQEALEAQKRKNVALLAQKQKRQPKPTPTSNMPPFPTVPQSETKTVEETPENAKEDASGDTNANAEQDITGDQDNNDNKNYAGRGRGARGRGVRARGWARGGRGWGRGRGRSPMARKMKLDNRTTTVKVGGEISDKTEADLKSHFGVTTVKDVRKTADSNAFLVECFSRRGAEKIINTKPLHLLNEKQLTVSWFNQPAASNESTTKEDPPSENQT
eukprot:TRINITY_DN21854_c0_g1_i1.p1 TRINITY_DN21854_c0_g1~~TRINITY_DN21854_c0_g1_i1.p1  ORF type:complete len:228 (+),score=47.00 TRINITY_DN21854_c0_g1_i1:30-686(+)